MTKGIEVLLKCLHCGGGDFNLMYDGKEMVTPFCKDCDEWFVQFGVGEKFDKIVEKGYIEYLLEGKDVKKAE